MVGWLQLDDGTARLRVRHHRNRPMQKAPLLIFGAALFTCAIGHAVAQRSPGDQTFATKAAAGGHAEVSLGNLAMKNASSPEVRQFGQQMVTDHTQANQELQAIAKQQNLTLPDKPDAASSMTEQRLETSKGTAFDTAYVHDMVKDHQQDVADYQQEASAGADPALKGFAQKYLPILKHHLEMAQAIEAKR
jgi:putative membrane protein